VGARAPFDKGRFVAVEALSKSAKWLSCESRLCSIGSEGSMPSSKGISPPTSLLALNMSEGVSRRRLEPWPCMGSPLGIPNFVYSGTTVKPWSRASFRTLVV
jgi:hypothetical protein